MIHVENSNKHLQNPWITKLIFFQELLNDQKAIEDIFLSGIPAINIITTMNLAGHFFSFRYQITHVDLPQYLHQNIVLFQCCDTVYLYHNGLVRGSTLGYFRSKLLVSIWCHISVGHYTVLRTVAQVGPRFCCSSLRALYCFLNSCSWCCSCSALLSKDASQIPHANKPRPEEPEHLIQLHVSGLFSFCSDFFSPPHFVLLKLLKSMRQNQFCQAFLNLLKILISSFLLLTWHFFSRMMAVFHIGACSREKNEFTGNHSISVLQIAII